MGTSASVAANEILERRKTTNMERPGLGPRMLDDTAATTKGTAQKLQMCLARVNSPEHRLEALRNCFFPFSQWNAGAYNSSTANFQKFHTAA